MREKAFEPRKYGFTLIELLVTITLIGVLTGIAVPLANSYRMKAEYTSLQTTLRYLLDGQEVYFIENGSFYPGGFRAVRVSKGEEKAIPELNYTFPAGHKHTYYIRALNLKFGGSRLNYSWIYVYADFDRDRNGRNDLYIAMTYLIDNNPITIRGKKYYRLIQQFR